MKPKVSIIMGVYNAEKTLSKSIDSIIGQTYQNWELIICDDCSTDETIKVLEEYQNKDSRIKIIQNQTNRKLAFSLNRCLEIAQGEFIARMDADDISLPHRLAVQVEFLNKHPEYAVVGSAINVFDGQEVVSIRTMKEYPIKEDVYYGPTFMHPTIMMRKSVYDALNGYTVAKRTQRGQDWDLWFRFFYKGYQGYNLQEPLLHYHESREDLKKRTFKTTMMYIRTLHFGLKLLNAPLYRYFYLFKPMISFLIPHQLKHSIK